MNELLQLYLERVTDLLAQLDADVARRSVPSACEWSRAVAAIQQDLHHMAEMDAEQLDSALTQQRARLAQLGELYLRLSRDSDP